ncbi:MAG: hypothetical protein IPM45_16280 [Acidimicrobiales bacterium]|nr:hypothetical protein [Acidimicrobiales bacterium]
MSVASARTAARGRGDRGQAGGAEVIAFGLLVFVVGALLAASAWGVVDAKGAVTAAAREAARRYVEARSADEAERSARAAAAITLAGYGRDPARATVTISGGFTRCQPVVVEVQYRMATVALPWLGRVGPVTTVHGRHAEIVDPWRSGPPGGARCPA